MVSGGVGFDAGVYGAGTPVTYAAAAPVVSAPVTYAAAAPVAVAAPSCGTPTCTQMMTQTSYVPQVSQSQSAQTHSYDSAYQTHKDGQEVSQSVRNEVSSSTVNYPETTVSYQREQSVSVGCPQSSTQVSQQQKSWTVQQPSQTTSSVQVQQPTCQTCTTGCNVGCR